MVLFDNGFTVVLLLRHRLCIVCALFSSKFSFSVLLFLCDGGFLL